MNVNLAFARNAAINTKFCLSTMMRGLVHRIQPEIVIFANKNADEEGTHLER